MMTRRLDDNATSSVTPTSLNTLWSEDHLPSGEAQQYNAITREVKASTLYEQLADVDDQHAVYLNAVPLVIMADAAEVTEKLVASGSWKGSGPSDAPLSRRVQTYLTNCGDSSFGLSEDLLKQAMEFATKPLPA